VVIVGEHGLVKIREDRTGQPRTRAVAGVGNNRLATLPRCVRAECMPRMLP
jgi:hypothetical protein